MQTARVAHDRVVDWLDDQAQSVELFIVASVMYLAFAALGLAMTPWFPICAYVAIAALAAEAFITMLCLAIRLGEE